MKRHWLVKLSIYDEVFSEKDILKNDEIKKPRKYITFLREKRFYQMTVMNLK